MLASGLPTLDVRARVGRSGENPGARFPSGSDGDRKIEKKLGTQILGQAKPNRVWSVLCLACV